VAAADSAVEKISVRVNGEEQTLPAGASVADLLRQLGLGAERVAVERNRGVVPRAAHAETRLVAGDALEVVTFVGGG
jgi:thiamine biosynthesis protein ThiS